MLTLEQLKLINTLVSQLTNIRQSIKRLETADESLARLTIEATHLTNQLIALGVDPSI